MNMSNFYFDIVSIISLCISHWIGMYVCMYVWQKQLYSVIRFVFLYFIFLEHILLCETDLSMFV